MHQKPMEIESKDKKGGKKKGKKKRKIRSKDIPRGHISRAGEAQPC
jgi:hypothetical protein